VRLFFALWPDAAAAARLAALSTGLALLAGGRAVPQAKIHLTLVFLGDVEDAALDAALELPEGLAPASFEVVLDQVGSFRGARVAWAGCRAAARGLADLHDGIAERARRVGFALEERPYSPHVTLARKIGRPIARRDADPIAWQARSFALVRSELGRGSYATLREWVLR
jgi:2'-5' RNA ligase